MLKRQRNYKAVFEIGDREETKLIPRQQITIEPPFTLQLHTNSGIQNTASNTGHFQFINLSEDVKSTLWLDVWNYGKKYIFMSLYAGYGENLPLIFAGFVTQCFSYKQGGSTDFITEIVTNNNGMMLDSEYINATFVKGTKLVDILKYVTANDKYTHVGYITPDISPLKRDKTFIGQPLDILKREYGGYSVFIADNEINILGNRDVIPGEIQVISDESGLLGSPKRSDAWVECEMIFEPQLKAGQAVALNSTTLPFLNRAYKIIQVEHRGIISPVVCGKLTTSVALAIVNDGDQEMNELKKETQSSYTAPPSKGIWSKPTLIGQITSAFGKRAKPNEKASTDHKGIDIGVPENTPVYATANGKVTLGYEGYKKGYGKFITIDHGKIDNKNVTSWYGHLSKWEVNQGQNVSKGQLIAYSGNTGNTTGPHLHFGINENGTFVNPAIYIGSY
ncbi:MAG: M23 family metallopeptidase [Clostridia bacterium]|nr:M23 family metallopeptidase [Clostridia bacterium]